MLVTFGWAALGLAADQHQLVWHTGCGLAWPLTILVAVALVTRGVFLGRPVTCGHAGTAAVMLAAGLFAHVLSFDGSATVLVAGSAALLMWPTTSHPQQQCLPQVWALVQETSRDPLAPFAMGSRKSYYFNADGTAAIAHCARLGFAAVSGDPIGDESRFAELVAGFAAMCHSQGWRILVLAAGERRLALWRDAAVIGQSLRAVPIGSDVVIDVATFTMVGRKYRNLRQAVARTHNCGIVTEVIGEGDLDDRLRAELTEVLLAAHRAAQFERGFSMILDGALEGRYPGILLIVGRDKGGRVQAFHRYATAGGGTDVTLDVPFRRPGAPSGIDERLSVDMISYAKAQHAQCVSLVFAPFPEIFSDSNRRPVQSLCYVLTHLLDPLIKLESLYQYLRKFDSFGERRYTLLSMRHLLPALIVFLTLEFEPRRRRLPAPTARRPASGSTPITQLPQAPD